MDFQVQKKAEVAAFEARGVLPCHQADFCKARGSDGYEETRM